MSRRSRRALLLIAYVLVIFAGSSIPGLNPPGPETLPKDKIAHFFEYLILGALLVRGIGAPRRAARWSMLAFLVAVGATIGALDEMYQSFIPGRDMSAADWVADTVGAATGVWACGWSRFGAADSGLERGDSAA